MAQVSLKLCTLVIQDSGGSNSITVTIGDGNFSWTENKEREYVLDRGNIDEIRDGDDAPVEVSFDARWEYITGVSVASGSSATPTISDALKQEGAAGAWVSTDADTCRPYCVDLILTYSPYCNTGDKETITFEDFRYESLAFDTDAGRISVSGKCNILTPTSVRESNSE